MKSLYILGIMFTVLIFAGTSSKLYFPQKPADLAINQYETYTKKLQKKYDSEDDYGIAFYLAALEAPVEKINKHLQKGIKINPEKACESIFSVQRFAGHRFYQVIYRYDTLTFKKAFNSCLSALGEDAFDLYMEKEDERSAAYQKKLPQIDSTKMDTSLMKVLQNIYEDDQKYRKKVDILYNTEEENNRYYALMDSIDAINLIKVDSLINTIGCVKPAVVGYDASTAMFLVLHHQSDLKVRKKYRNFIEDCYFGRWEMYDIRTADIEKNQVLETISERVNKCLENADTLGFTIVETGQKGFSHDVEEECIIGAVLPTFETKDINSQTVNTKSLQDKVNVINFWFTECKLCIKEMPYLNTLVDTYANKNVNFVAFNRDNIDETKDFLKSNEFNFQILPETKDIVKNKFNMIWGYPLTIVTDKQNEVVGVFRALDDETKVQKIEELIEENI